MSTFKGFEKPTDNYSKLPHSLIDQLPIIETMAEMKVVIYLLRHTWGFSEFGKPKKLSTDEFAKGRKKRDQTRMDEGTGLSENSVRAGLEKAVEHGFIIVETDETDKARIEKWYCLNMEVDSDIAPRPAKIAPLDADVAPRSEKETIERKEITPFSKKTDEQPPKYRVTKQDIMNMSPEAAIFGGGLPSQVAQDKTILEQSATSAFEQAWHITRPWDWWSAKKDWRDLLAFVVEIYQADTAAFGRYVTWYDERGKFAGGRTAAMIRRDPTCFYAAWDEFKRQDKGVEIEAVTHPVYDPAAEPKKNFVPAPENLIRRRHATE